MRFRAELFIFSENLVINAGMAEFRAQVYTCELCGEDGFKEEDLRFFKNGVKKYFFYCLLI